MKSIFLAVPKDMPGNEHLNAIKTLFPDHNVVLSVEDWNDNFHGDWKEWIRSINGADYWSRQPRYEIIICTSNPVGRATAQIVEGALEINKDVKHWDGEFCHSITCVQTMDDTNWQSGWRLK
jgi:hypothetical protein